MAVAVELWRYVAPLLHRVVAEEVVAVDGADAAEGEDAVGSVPDIVRHHVGGGGDMDVCAVEATGDEACEPLVGVIEGPAVEEGDALVVRRELGMGDEVAGTLHILRRLHLGEVGEGEKQRARVLIDVDEVEACVCGGGLVKVAAVLNVVAVAGHHFLQAAVAEGCGVAAVVADGVDGVGDLTPHSTLLTPRRYSVDLGTEAVVATGVEDERVVGVAEPLQTAALVIGPGVGSGHFIELTILTPHSTLLTPRKIPIPDSKRLAGLGHAEGNVQLTAEHVAFVRGDG